VDSTDSPRIGGAVAQDAPGSPLGRPPGTVRAYLAMAIVAAFLVAHVAGSVLLLWAGAREAAMGLLGALAVEAATVTGFYFGARQADGPRAG